METDGMIYYHFKILLLYMLKMCLFFVSYDIWHIRTDSRIFQRIRRLGIKNDPQYFIKKIGIGQHSVSGV